MIQCNWLICICLVHCPLLRHLWINVLLETFGLLHTCKSGMYYFPNCRVFGAFLYHLECSLDRSKMWRGDTMETKVRIMSQFFIQLFCLLQTQKFQSSNDLYIFKVEWITQFQAFIEPYRSILPIRLWWNIFHIRTEPWNRKTVWDEEERRITTYLLSLLIHTNLKRWSGVEYRWKDN